jgi:hypothetical protein
MHPISLPRPSRCPCLVGVTAFLFLSLASLLDGLAAEAANGAGSELTLKTERAVVFKDGYCLVLKRAVGVTDRTGAVYTDDVPDAAVLGSFWATPKDGRLLSMVAGWEDRKTCEDKQLPCLQTIEVLKANVGMKCSVQLPDNSFLQGTIQHVLTQDSTVALDDDLRATLGVPSNSPIASRLPTSSSLPVPDPATRSLSAIAGTYFVLRAEQGDVLLAAGDVRRLTITDMKTTWGRKLTTTQRTKRLTFRFAEPGQRRELLIAYFRPGVRWIPSYRIDLGEPEGRDKVADIALQAELLNEAENLIEAPLDIVVGVPNFRFRTLPSPLTLEQTLRNALVQAAPQLMSQFSSNALSNALFTQRAGEFRREQAAAPDQPQNAGIELPSELTAAAAQELFVYHLPPLTLRRGERAAVPIMAATCPYRDVYTWDLHPTRPDIATAPSGAGVSSPLVLSENQVWRQIELTNAATAPWTTGAAMIMQGQQPLAQELLTYTSPKDICRVPVTVAVDLRGSFAEQEIERQLQALNWDNNHYAKIRHRATLTLRNNKAQPVDVEITLRLGGRAEQATHEGRITLAPYRAEDWENYRGSPAVNNSSTVLWKTTLQPGEKFEPTVEYQFYARH